MNEALTLSIIKAILDHGPSAVEAIANALKQDKVTPEDIDKLFITKSPEDYFNGER